MSETVSKELRLVLLAALAFSIWRDTGYFPEILSREIDDEELIKAIDSLSGVT